MPSLIGVLRKCLSLLCLLAISSSGVQPALAFKDEIRVQLFQAHPDLKLLQITGPFTLMRPINERFPNGVYNLRAASSGSVDIDRGGARIYSAHAITIAGATSSKSVVLQLHGVRRSYVGTIQIACADPASFPRLMPAFSQERRQPENATPNAPDTVVSPYIGKTIRSTGRRNLFVVNTLPIRNYIESVVGSETQPHWPLEALKAIALLVQTNTQGFPNEQLIGDSTQRQAYFGNDYARPEVKQAVSSVWGETLTYHGTPIKVFYHPTCAGRTSSAIDVFGSAAKDLRYLAGTKCRFCKDAPFWKATVTHVPDSAFRTAFGADLPEILKTDEAGRPKSILLKRRGCAVEISGYRFWTELGQRFGWDKAPGLRFTLLRVGDKVEVRSTGAGHGVGLCEWGAVRQARAGKTYEQILHYYFRSVQLKPHLSTAY
jgi:stage II sporulation protein D